MAIYRVEVPDGSVIKIEAPDNATPEQVTAFAKANWAAPKSANVSPPPKSPLINTPALIDTIKDLPQHATRAGLGFAQGIGDLAVGAGQLVSHMADPLIPGAANRFDNYMRSREEDYQQQRGTDNVDIGRITGNIVPTLATGGATAAPSMLGRMGQGAKLGGLLGATSPVNPDAPSFLAAKGLQTGIGAAAGGLAPPIVEGVTKAVGATVNALANKVRGFGSTITGQSSPIAVESTLKIELERGGIDWNSLSQTVRASLVSNVQNSLKNGSQVDTDAVRRMADFERIGAPYLRGQISRDPRQFATEQNLSKMEVGKPIADRLTQQNNRFISVLDEARGPAQSADPYAAGQTAIKTLATRDASRKAGVDAAYTEARNLAGIEADVPLQPVAQRIGQIVDDFGDDKIPGAVMSRLKEFGLLEGKQTKVFNIREAEKLKTLIGNNIENPSSPSGKALTMLKRSVDDAVNTLAEGGAGAEAAGAFQTARAAASQRFGQIDKSPALAEVVEKSATPDKFIEKHYIRGEVANVANNLRSLVPEARSEVRAAVVDWIKGKTLIGGADDAAKFSQTGLKKALETIGERKLDLLFAGDRQTLDMLKALSRASSYANVPPVASGVNHSNSATTIMDALDKATRLPVVGALLGKPGDIVRATQAAKAVAPGLPMIPPRPMLNPSTTNEFAKRLGLLAAPLAPVGVAGLLGRQ